nr:hypothetical protein [Tanacetum cinerariifolium]
MVISKLKDRIKSLSGNKNTDKVKKEKDLVIKALKDDLRKLKGKALVYDVVTSHSIAPEMLKVDVEPFAPKLLNNRTAHSDYLRHTHEQAAILKEVVKQGKSQNPFNHSLDHAEILEEYLKEMKEDLVKNFEYQKSDSSMKASSKDENQLNCLAGESQELEDPEEIPLEDIFEEIKNTVSRRINKGESSNLNQKAPM